ncbi:MAG: OmpH family outer membrane protein [Candidatus Xiphinematobacter sp.]|nr:MAG: OmpH family outer membrane protein [Candidatus Xiphinematobacter sp.]
MPQSLSLLSSSLLAAGILLFGASAHAVRIGAVDMNRVFTEYYKTKEAQSQLNAERESSKQHLEERLAKLKDTMKAIEVLSQEIKKPELSRLAREGEAKVKEARELDRECSSFRTMREQQLQEKFGRMRADIVQDIMKVVNAKVKAVSYDFVFDKSGLGFGGIPVVLYAANDVDLTAQVISELNKGAPKEKKPKKA